MEKIDNLINQRIAGYRKLAGFTQSQAADILGMKRNTYARMEKHGNPSPEMLKKLSEIFDVKITMLLYGTDVEENEVKPQKIVFEQNVYSDVLPLSLMETNIIRVIRSLPSDDVKSIIDNINEVYSKSVSK